MFVFCLELSRSTCYEIKLNKHQWEYIVQYVSAKTMHVRSLPWGLESNGHVSMVNCMYCGIQQCR
jgi:hypothetical protein